LQKYQREVESLRHENDELVEQSLAIQHKSDKDSREVESIKKLMRDREEDYRRRTDAAERRAKELELDLKKLNSQYAALHDKG
jgi:chromosome segregation ATPase